MDSDLKLLFTNLSEKIDKLSDKVESKLNDLEAKLCNVCTDVMRHDIILSGNKENMKTKFDKQLVLLAGGISLFNGLLFIIIEVVLKVLK